MSTLIEFRNLLLFWHEFLALVMPLQLLWAFPAPSFQLPAQLWIEFVLSQSAVQSLQWVVVSVKIAHSSIRNNFCLLSSEQCFWNKLIMCEYQHILQIEIINHRSDYLPWKNDSPIIEEFWNFPSYIWSLIKSLAVLVVALKLLRWKFIWTQWVSSENVARAFFRQVLTLYPVSPISTWNWPNAYKDDLLPPFVSFSCNYKQ